MLALVLVAGAAVALWAWASKPEAAATHPPDPGAPPPAPVLRPLEPPEVELARAWVSHFVAAGVVMPPGNSLGRALTRLAELVGESTMPARVRRVLVAHHQRGLDWPLVA
jgi:hypothetical protein